MNDERGITLIEVMTVIFILSMMAMSSTPLFYRQMADRELDGVAREFIRHAQFARQQALILGEVVRISPLKANSWDEGWVVQSGSKHSKIWLTRQSISPIYFKDGAKQFIDIHSQQKEMFFNVAGAAKTGHGGFVANRIILGHQKAPHLERQLIMGSGGRWRICNPRLDVRRCY